MPAEVTYSASEGLPTAPGRFVIRRAGLLVRGEDALPVLYPTLAAAQTEADKLAKEEADEDA